MAFWGAKLYQDDVAQDVRDYYKDQLKRGKTNEEVTKELINNNENIILDEDEAPVFWFSLADTQWNLGRLLPLVKEKALEYLKSGTNLTIWKKEFNKNSYKIREKVLNDLEQKLNSPMPSEKNISQYKLYTCEWKIGDVFAYKLDSNYAKEKNMHSRYFLFQKVGETIWHPGHIVPIVRVKITKNDVLPKTEEEFNKLEYIQTSVIKYEDRFLSFDLQHPIEEQILEKSKIKYEIDDYGYLPQFRLILSNTSKRIIPKKIFYIGNFPNTISPSKEFIPHSPLNIPSFAWKYFDKLMIDTYLGHNLRQYAIYSNNK